MDNKIKKSYEKMNITEEAKNRIQMAVIMENDKNLRKQHNNIKWNTWKVVVAACLIVALVVPTGAYAATKLYQYFNTSVSTTNNSVNMKISKSETSEKKPDRYIKLSADFGKDYSVEKTEFGVLADKDEENAACISYDYKGGFYSGKCFWYELEYIDCDRDEVLVTYDNESYESITINGRKAVYCKYNDVVNSRYSSDNKNEYGQSIYIFIEDYGYLLQMTSQRGLDKKDFIALAEKIQIKEVSSEKEASNYVLYSNRSKSGWEIKSDNVGSARVIDATNYYMDGVAVVGDTKVKVNDVQVLDSVTSLDRNAFHISDDYFDYDKIVGKDGKIRTYEREKIKYGDGVNRPEREVEVTETVQPKLVYVTAEFKGAKSPIHDGNYPVPSLQLVKKSDGKIYDNDVGYNRPTYISDAFTDLMPCYFKESLGGKEYWFAKIDGDKLTLHFAYLVDEDLLDGMALCLNHWSSSARPIYLDISQK